jgi:hypothetical protein
MSLLAASAPLFGYLFFALVVGIICVGIVTASRQNSRARKNLTELASRLGIPVNPDLRIPKLERTCNNRVFGLGLGGPATELGIQGTVRGRTVRFSRFITGAGKSQQVWAELAVSARANGFTFTLRSENIAWKVIERLGFHEVKVGDAAFDERWRIKASDAATLQALLLPELREKISAAARRSGDFHLDHDWVRYREQGSFSNDQLVARLEGMVAMMCDLAEAIEVATEKYSPLSPGGP